MPHRIMESRLVLTPKPLEPHEVEPAKQEGILLDWDSEEPCKAKARHVMKGFSEEGSEDIEATTPQVTREGTLMVAQLVASHRWKLGFLDFTQAFHSGDAIDRLLYATTRSSTMPTPQAGKSVLRAHRWSFSLVQPPKEILDRPTGVPTIAGRSLHLLQAQAQPTDWRADTQRHHRCCYGRPSTWR